MVQKSAIPDINTLLQPQIVTIIVKGLAFYLDNELSTGNDMYLKVKVYC